MTQPRGPRVDYSQVPVGDAKKMPAQPDEIERVSRARATIRNTLAGAKASGNTGGNAAGDLRKAVRDVREHWDGPAAEAFEKQANMLVIKMTNLAGRADRNSTELLGAKGDLLKIKEKVDAVEPPGLFARGWDAMTDTEKRDDADLQADIKSGIKSGMSYEEAAWKRESELPEGKERQLENAQHMQTLAARYPGPPAHPVAVPARPAEPALATAEAPEASRVGTAASVTRWRREPDQLCQRRW